LIRKRDKVYVQRGASYVRGYVQKVTQQPDYEVAFDDGSVCTNLPPGDILGHDVVKGDPAVGSSVQVIWSDHHVYSAKFIGCHPSPIYTVQCEDGFVLQVGDDQIYSLKEKLPRKVQMKVKHLEGQQP